VKRNKITIQRFYFWMRILLQSICYRVSFYKLVVHYHDQRSSYCDLWSLLLLWLLLSLSETVVVVVDLIAVVLDSMSLGKLL